MGCYNVIFKITSRGKRKKHDTNSNNFSISKLHNFASHSSTQTSDPHELPIHKMSLSHPSLVLTASSFVSAKLCHLISKEMSNHFHALLKSDVKKCDYSENTGLGENILVLVLILKMFHSNISLY
jgi:hypothetical protein